MHEAHDALLCICEKTYVTEKNRLTTKGIEVGHIFYFGDKYSKPLNASVDFKGKKVFRLSLGESILKADTAAIYSHSCIRTLME